MMWIELNECEKGIMVFAKGHAGYAPAGRDVVCAGISAILYGSLNFFRKQADEQGEPASAEAMEGPGRLYIRAGGFADGLEYTALKVMHAQLCALEEAYPEYVSVRYVDHRKNETGGSETV